MDIDFEGLPLSEEQLQDIKNVAQYFECSMSEAFQARLTMWCLDNGEDIAPEKVEELARLFGLEGDHPSKWWSKTDQPTKDSGASGA